MIPALLLIPALAAGAGGLGGVFHGINNLAEAKELSKGAEALNEENLARFKNVCKHIFKPYSGSIKESALAILLSFSVLKSRL